MADADKTLKALRQATMLLRATPGRKGSLIEPVDCDEILVAGDLHGNLRNFRSILNLADLANRPRRHLVLQEFVHGSGRYPDGSCTSHQLLDLIAVLKCQYPSRVHLLPGNHELSEVTGRTIAKNGVALNTLFANGIEHAYGLDREVEVTAAYHEFILAMALAIRTANRLLLVHTIPDGWFLDKFDYFMFDVATIPAERRGKSTSMHHLLWDRDVDEASNRRFIERMGCDLAITGHIAAPNGFSAPNRVRLIVDCVDGPAACVLVPTTVRLTHEQLVERIVLLPP